MEKIIYNAINVDFLKLYNIQGIIYNDIINYLCNINHSNF